MNNKMCMCIEPVCELKWTNQLHSCFAKQIHTFWSWFWVKVPGVIQCDPVWSWLHREVHVFCMSVTLLSVSWDWIGSVGGSVTSTTWPPCWKASCSHRRKFLPVITSWCTLFSPSFHFPNGPAVLLKAHSSANVTKYCTHQLPCTYQWVQKATSSRRQPAHTLPQKSLKRRVLSTVIGCQTSGQ